jgi:hypothetical protein
VTVPEAASHLSILFGEDVSEADIFRLALVDRIRHLEPPVSYASH